MVAVRFAIRVKKWMKYIATLRLFARERDGVQPRNRQGNLAKTYRFAANFPVRREFDGSGGRREGDKLMDDSFRI